MSSVSRGRILKQYWDRLVALFGAAKRDLRNYGSTRRKIRRLLLGDSFRLEIGSGPLRRDGWTGIDLDCGSDLPWDLHWGLPFPDSSVEEIHSEHCFEHFSREELENLLKECHRVLKPGKRISFSVPNLAPYFAAYAEGNI